MMPPQDYHHEYRHSLQEHFRTATTVIKQVAIAANANTQLLSRSPRRLAVRICNTATALIDVFDLPLTAGGQGMRINQGLDKLITQWFDGDLATHEWHVWSGTAVTIVVEEVLSTCPCATGH